MKAWIVGLAVTCAACAAHPVKGTSTEASLLRDWTLSRCLAKASTGSDFSQDAMRTAAALLERGSVDIAIYEKLDSLVDRFLARRSEGSVPGSYSTLKCIDLYHSDELSRSLGE
jgi:hypothetical protein